MNDRKLIEGFVELLGAEGLRALSEEARREKAIRRGHISTLHVWWARRPLVVSRAAILGALLPEGSLGAKDITSLCQWEVHDGDPAGRYLLEKARRLIREVYPDGPPKVLDPMAGGGSIPLEALRLGCEAHALEYNPVAYIILKATLEYPQRYGRRLAEEVRRWGEWVLERAREELSDFYPSVDGQTPIAYIWSRTVKCPGCGGEVLLFRQFWLARKPNKRAALKPFPDRKAGKVEFQIVKGEEIDFDPSQGTVRRAQATCLLCNTGIPDKYLKAEANAGRMGHRLVAVVTTHGKGQGREYRLAQEKDLEAFERAKKCLDALKAEGKSPWAFNLSLVPEEGPSYKAVWNDDMFLYGMPKWGSLFNPRQLLSLVTFGRLVREAYKEMLGNGEDPEFAKAVTTYLALAVDKLANWISCLSHWEATWQMPKGALPGHRIAMVFDYAEANPITEGPGSWYAASGYILRVLAGCSIPNSGRSGNLLASATRLSFEDEGFDAVVVDPPYYDNVPYADLSDFFYVWLRRIIGDLYPEAFGTALVPKDEEIVHNPARWGGGKEGEERSRAHYRRLLTQSFREMARVLRPEGRLVVMFTHRSLSAWEELLESLIEAGVYATASFPVHTEMEASIHQRGKGAVKSTIILSCRKRLERETGYFHEVRRELVRRLKKRLDAFWDAGVKGADFFISAIGPAIEIYGKYDHVLRPDGRKVEVKEWLEEVHRLVADHALERLDGLGQVDEATRFYILWRWAYGGAALEFDDARKLSIGVGADLEALRRTGLIWGQETVFLPTALERWKDDRAAKAMVKALEEGQSEERMALIDAVHTALVLWNKAEEEALGQFLSFSGMGESETFWHTCQALLQVEEEWLRRGVSSGGREEDEEDEEGNEDKGRGDGVGALAREVTLLRQFLGAREGLVRRARREGEQMRLF